MIIGANEVGEKFREVIAKNPEFGHRFVGYINNNLHKDVIGDFTELDKIIKEKNVEDVVIALHNDLISNLDELVRICNRNAVNVHFIPDYFKFLSGRYQLSTVSNLPVITIRDEPLNEAMKRFVKRFFDVIFSSIIILFVLSWFIPIVGLLIKLDSKGYSFLYSGEIRN